MNVVFLSPSYPTEMPHYVRGLAEVGARVLGVGDSPAAALSPSLRGHLADYLQVPGILDEEAVMAQVMQWLDGQQVDRVEGLWEPVVILAARLREALGIRGMSVSTVQGFRDKEIMKQRVAAAGLRVPRSARIHTRDQAWAVAEQIGFPLILKPIAGAGSADTHRCDEPGDLDVALDRLGHVPEASCEEFVDGEEFTFDTVCIEGRPAFMNVCQYIPRPLVARTNEWISPQQITIRNLDQPALRSGIELGLGVLDALGMGTGFTHMEWYRKRDGEVVFGEIACRPGGGHLVDQMNLTCDIDLFREWARAACWHAFEASTHRKYNVACIFKRARGQGRIREIQGLEAYRRQFGPGICWENLLPVGTPRRDWRQTLVSDGFVMVRHPDWTEVRRMADAAATGIQLWAE